MATTHVKEFLSAAEIDARVKALAASGFAIEVGVNQPKPRGSYKKKS